jgi:hypothetical protein
MGLSMISYLAKLNFPNSNNSIAVAIKQHINSKFQQPSMFVLLASH